MSSSTTHTGDKKTGGGGGGFFSGLFGLFTSFTGAWTNPFAQKRLKELSSPTRADWRQQTRDIWTRPYVRLPLDIDLPRLASRITIEDHRTCAPDLLLPADPFERDGDPAFQHPEPVVPRPVIVAGAGASASATAGAGAGPTSDTLRRNYRAVCEFLYELVYVLGGGRAKAEAARARFETEISVDADLAVQKKLLQTYLAEEIGEDTPAGRCLKAVNQAIIAPSNIEAHVNTLPGLPFKDSQQRPWEVVVRVFDDRVEVSHVRGQCHFDTRAADSAYEFLLETAFVFDRDAEHMTDAHIYIDEYSFGPETTQERKVALGQKLEANLRPLPSEPLPPARVVSCIGRRVSNYLAAHPTPASSPQPADAATATADTTTTTTTSVEDNKEVETTESSATGETTTTTTETSPEPSSQ